MRRVKWVRQEPKILGVSLDVFPLMLIIIVAVTLVGLYFLLNVATSAIFAILFVDAVIYILFYYKSINRKKSRQYTKLPDRLYP